jgi:uncharacterized OB-fold protein
VSTTEFVAPFTLSYSYKRSLGPVLSEWATGLRDGKLLGARCKDGTVLAPATEVDPRTGDAIDRLVPIGPVGTVVHATNGWALITLDGADTPMLHRVDGAARPGDRVVARWNDVRTGTIADLAFVPGEEVVPAAPAESDEPVTRFRAPTSLDFEVTAGNITREFLQAILRKKLMGMRCPECTKVYVPPRGACPTCGVPPGERVPLPPIGTVRTFSVIRLPFEGQILEPPYACAHVYLDGADSPLLHIVGECDVDDVHVGMRVEAVWAETPEPSLESLRYFRPVGTP